MIYANPGDAGSVVSFEKRFGNYIGGEFVPRSTASTLIISVLLTAKYSAKFPALALKTLRKR